MKKFFLIFITIFVAIPLIAKDKQKASNKEVCTSVYAYGIATSFNDSIVYMTDVMKVDSVYFDIPKSNAIGGRKQYSRQFKDYLDNKGMTNRTCTFFYQPTKEKAEKSYIKLRKKLIQKYKFSTELISKEEFKFVPEKHSSFDTDNN